MCLQNLMNFHYCLFKISKKNQNVMDEGTTWKQYTPPTNIVCWGYNEMLNLKLAMLIFSFNKEVKECKTTIKAYTC